MSSGKWRPFCLGLNVLIMPEERDIKWIIEWPIQYRMTVKLFAKQIIKKNIYAVISMPIKIFISNTAFVTPMWHMVYIHI